MYIKNKLLLQFVTVTIMTSRVYAACNCDCLRPNRSVVTSQTVQNKAQCASACAFASQTSGQQLIQSDNCPIQSTQPSGPPPFNIPEECTGGPPPADAISGDNIFIDHQGGASPNVNTSCAYIDPGKTVSKIWCHITNDQGSDAYWCTYPGQPGKPSEERCGLWGDTKAWPDHIFQPRVDEDHQGKTAVCARAVNFSDWANRHFQIFVK